MSMQAKRIANKRALAKHNAVRVDLLEELDSIERLKISNKDRNLVTYFL